MYRARIGIVSIFLLLLLLLLYMTLQEPGEEPEDYTKPVLPQTSGGGMYAGVSAAFGKNIFDAGLIPSDISRFMLEPKEQASLVYSFLQGPKSYGEGIPWAGAWCEEMVGYNKFGGFGCGFCCMANIYSTLTDYECSPLDIFEFAKTASRYYPTSESGAIGWKDMKKTLKAVGFECKNYRKPATYKEFQENFSCVYGEQIVSHKILTDDVKCVKYGNGVSVYVNYGDEETTADGVTIPAKDYVVVRGGEQ